MLRFFRKAAGCGAPPVPLVNAQRVPRTGPRSRFTGAPTICHRFSWLPGSIPPPAIAALALFAHKGWIASEASPKALWAGAAMKRHFPGAQTVPHRFQLPYLCVRLALFLLLLFGFPTGLKLLDFLVNVVHLATLPNPWSTA